MRDRSALLVILGLGLASVVALPAPAAAQAAAQVEAAACAAVCERPEDVKACKQSLPVWGFRESGDVCRSGSFGYMESRESADAELRRLAKEQKRRCEATGDCERFEALDRAAVVCLACDPRSWPDVSAGPARPNPGSPPPCAKDAWLQVGEPGKPSRCFAEFPGLPPRLALRGKCVQGDCRGGVGTVKWPSGESYVGGFQRGKRHGQGTFRWSDGRMYIGEWRNGQPGGLGTRIFASGRFRAGYFDRGRYLGLDVDHVARLESRERRGPKRKVKTAANAPSCEEVCTGDAEVRLARINDDYECCFARHAFCTQKAEIVLEGCTSRACAERARLQQEDCDLRYSCDAVQTQKIARYRQGNAECVEACSSSLDDQGLRVSERGTLYDDD